MDVSNHDARRPSALLVALRDSTRHLHQRIENTGFMARLMADDLTLDQYACHLHRLHGFIRPIERLVVARIGSLPCGSTTAASWQYVPRYPRLEADLAHFGLDPAATKQATPAQLPALADANDALGAAYVLEGSVLGAKLINRQLTRRFGGRAPTAYYDANPGAGHWSRFLTVLSTSPLSDVQRSAVAQAAATTFSQLLAWVSSDSDTRARCARGSQVQ